MSSRGYLHGLLPKCGGRAAEGGTTLVGKYYYYYGLVFGRGVGRTDPFPNHVIISSEHQNESSPRRLSTRVLVGPSRESVCVWDSPTPVSRSLPPAHFLFALCGLWIVWPHFLAFSVGQCFSRRCVFCRIFIDLTRSTTTGRRERHCCQTGRISTGNAS
jgi:hypothetical protein